jgi:hypothetical protein
VKLGRRLPEEAAHGTTRGTTRGDERERGERDDRGFGLLVRRLRQGRTGLDGSASMKAGAGPRTLARVAGRRLGPHGHV